MAKRKTTKKQQPVTEPVIEYVDPETNLDMQTPEADIEKAPESAMQTPTDDFFTCMKRRRDKER